MKNLLRFINPLTEKSPEHLRIMFVEYEMSLNCRPTISFIRYRKQCHRKHGRFRGGFRGSNQHEL